MIRLKVLPGKGVEAFDDETQQTVYVAEVRERMVALYATHWAANHTTNVYRAMARIRVLEEMRKRFPNEMAHEETVLDGCDGCPLGQNGDNMCNARRYGSMDAEGRLPCQQEELMRSLGVMWRDVL